MSVENRGVLNLAPREFTSKGGSRVMQQFNEAILADEHLRSHDGYRLGQDHHQRSHDHHVRSYENQVPKLRGVADGAYPVRQPEYPQRSHDQRQRSHDYPQRAHTPQHHQHQHHFKPQQQHQELIDSSDYPLPDSPAPPPYKSPSPDSEQAQVLQQLNGRQPQGASRQPKQQFLYHAGALGITGGEEFGTDLSIVDDHDARERVNVREKGVKGETRRESGEKVKLLPQQQKQQQKRDDLPPQSHTPQGHALQDQASASMASASNGQPSKKTQEGQDGARHEQKRSKDRPRTPDIIKELEELMGGVEAMVSTANRDAEESPDKEGGEGATTTTTTTTTGHPEGDRQGETPASSRDIAGKENRGGADREEVLPPPLASPPQERAHPEHDLRADRAGSPEGRRSGGDRLMTGNTPAIYLSPEQGEDNVIDPPTPWRDEREGSPSNWQESEDNLADVCFSI